MEYRMNHAYILLVCMLCLGQTAGFKYPQDEKIDDKQPEMETLNDHVLKNIGSLQRDKPLASWPYVGDGCCNLSTTPRCKKAGGECIPRNETCVGDEYTGTKYCDINHLKSCKCCVTPNCETLDLCKSLGGSCNMTCKGKSISGKGFCKDSKHCKCCLPETPECPCGQDYAGGCKGQFTSGVWAFGHCMKTCSKGTIPLDNNTCNTTGGDHCKCCAKPVDPPITIAPKPEPQTTKTTTQSPKVPDCRDGAVSIGGQCLRYIIKKADSWYDAIKACSSINGQLVSLKNPQAVLDYTKKHYAGIEFWVGGSDIKVEGSWTWVSGAPIADLPWSGPACGFEHQPDNAGGYQNCLIVNWRCGGYDDQNCIDNTHPYICEDLPTTTTTPTTTKSPATPSKLYEVNITDMNGIAKASSIYSKEYNAMKAFEGNTFWNCGTYDVPHSLWVEFPKAIKIVSYSFTSRTDGWVSGIITQGPSKYIFWASNGQDCTEEAEWVTLNSDLSGTPFDANNSPKSAIFENKKYFRCYGFKVIDVPGRKEGKPAVIGNVHFYSDQVIA